MKALDWLIDWLIDSFFHSFIKRVVMLPLQSDQAMRSLMEALSSSVEEMARHVDALYVPQSIRWIRSSLINIIVFVANEKRPIALRVNPT